MYLVLHHNPHLPEINLTEKVHYIGFWFRKDEPKSPMYFTDVGRQKRFTDFLGSLTATCELPREPSILVPEELALFPRLGPGNT